MTFYVHVQDEQRNKSFTDEIEAESLDHAVDAATRQLLEAYLDTPPSLGQSERVLITISSNLNCVPDGSWRLTLKEKVLML